MAFQEPVEAATLRLTVMAALSDGERRTMHPADIRRRLREAARISQAIQERFELFARSGGPPEGATPGILLPAES